MKPRTPYTAFIAISAILAAALLAGWAWIAYEGRSMKADIASIAGKTESAAADYAYLLSLKVTLRDSKDDLAAIDSRFIGKDGIPAFIDMLEARARAANVAANLGSISLDDSGDPLLPRTLSMHMTGAGLWKDATAFISEVESLPYALQVGDIELSRAAVDQTKAAGKAAPQGNVWNFNADLTAYVAN